LKTIFSLFLPLFFLASCTKETSENPEPCTPVLIVSDKYTIDTNYIKTDTIYRDCLSGHWLQVHREQKDSWFLMCDSFGNGFKLERLRHITGSEKKEIYRKR